MRTVVFFAVITNLASYARVCAKPSFSPGPDKCDVGLCANEPGWKPIPLSSDRKRERGINGRVALVTGAGRGIGREAALLLAAAETRVMAVSRSESELAATGLEYVIADLGTPEG